MTKSEFLEIAKAKISNSPFDRLSENTKKIILNDNYVVDIHCHFFDLKTINIKYFLQRMLKDGLGFRDGNEIKINRDDPNFTYLNINIEDIYEEEILNKEFDSDEDWLALEKELETVENEDPYLESNPKKGERGFFSKFRLRKLFFLKNMGQVYEYYLDKFALNQADYLGLENKDLLVTALMMDLGTGWQCKIRKSMRDQIKELKKLSRKKPVLPFFPIDPRRADLVGEENLYNLFMEAFSSTGDSFFGVKVYPGLGYFPSDHRLLPIYQICQEKNIPVLTHCGGEAVTTNFKEINGFRLNKPTLVKGKTRQILASKLNHPQEWLPVLEKFPDLKLNLGHFGGDKAWENYSKQGESEKVKMILDMMIKYSNVYADFSFNIIDSKVFGIYKTVIDISQIALERSLYGSDFWVVCGSGNLKKRQKEFLTKLKVQLDKLAFENPKRYLFESYTA